MSKFNNRAFFYAGVVAMGGFVFGLDAALISGTINFIVKEFSLTDLQLGTAVSAPGIGVLLALPLAGYAADFLGRKKTLQIIALLYVVSAICSALAPSFGILVAARFLGGLAFSSITLASMYIGEIAPPTWRGKMVSMTQINIVFGLSAAYFLNYLILQATSSDAAWVETIGLRENTWRWMLGTEVIPALVWLGMLFLIPKSPSWLVMKNRIDDARLTLAKIVPPESIQERIRETQESLATNLANSTKRDQIKEIFSKGFRPIFFIALTIAIAQQATGINAVLFYAPTIFEQLGIGTDAAFMQAIWIGLTSIVFTVLALLLVDKLGRRPMVIWGLVWIIASLAICSQGFRGARYNLTAESIGELTEIPNPERLESLVGIEYASDINFKKAISDAVGEQVARDNAGLLLQKAAKMNGPLIVFGILSFIAAFHFSVGPIMWVLFSELFPIGLRGVAIPFFALITSLVNVGVQQFFPWQLTNMGSASIFLFYAAVVAVCLVILFRILPETKNIPIEKIAASLMSKAD